ncbi:XdhC family protein [Kovacikia minuta CCNUW1]|uniref:XdhC family protein n=1 Tax=Kovacikia minuta TaxID=2931930 RepID=UPI001CCF7551|nr:XdhC/CoxI family protein [Kovacikia minuta]UBF27031.1 XdhC family protein [Kovacikia minuta CCNUW1]
MLEFYQQMAEALKQQPVVLATVARIKGSVPREVGAKMVIRADGSIIGTIGGGAGEAKVIRQARSVLETGEKQFVEIDLSGAPQRETQGVCGGMMQVWLERWQGETAWVLVNQIIERLKSGKSGTLVTPFEQDRSPHLHLPPPTEPPPSSPILHPSFLLEPLLSPPTLLIIGAGHVAVPLAHIAYQCGFRILVQDDRPEFANSQRFPEAAAILAQPISEALDSVPEMPELYAALVTRGYRHDLAALQLLVQREIKYIGMIGSEKRVKTVLHTLQQEMNLDAETQFIASPQTIHAPIGLDIGALTPEEIAVSICAELIKVRRGGTGLPLSSKPGQVEQSPVRERSL